MTAHRTTAKLIRFHVGELAPTAARPPSHFGELPPDAVLTTDQVAAWLQVRPRQLERLGVPRLDLGRKTKRYLARDVLAWIQYYRGR